MIKEVSCKTRVKKENVVFACILLGGGTRAWLPAFHFVCWLHHFGLDFLLITCSYSFSYKM